MPNKLPDDPRPSTSLERGIQRAQDCLRANVRYRGRRRWKKFPLDTPLPDVRAWRVAKLRELKAQFLTDGLGATRPSHPARTPDAPVLPEAYGFEDLEPLWDAVISAVADHVVEDPPPVPLPVLMQTLCDALTARIAIAVTNTFFTKARS